MTTTTVNGIRLYGQLLLPGDAGYDESRTVWNAMVDRHPRMIFRCATTQDVVTAVRTARELDLEIGIRCGGHSVLGMAVPDGGGTWMMNSSALRDETADRRQNGNKAARHDGHRPTVS